MMDKNAALIEYIFQNENLDFVIDVENKKVFLKDYDVVNQQLFNQTAELKKEVFRMYLNGEDVALNRIKTKLLETYVPERSDCLFSAVRTTEDCSTSGAKSLFFS